MLSKKSCVALLILVSSLFSHSQNEQELLVHLKNLNFEQARLEASKFDKRQHLVLDRLVYLIELNDIVSIDSLLNNLYKPSHKNELYNLTDAYQKLYNHSSRIDDYKLFKDLIKSRDTELKKAAYLEIFKVLDCGIIQSDDNYKNYLTEYRQLISDVTDST